MREEGKQLKAMRLGAGLTLEQMAERLGCSSSYLSRLERGERIGSPFFLAHLARVLGEMDGDAA